MSIDETESPGTAAGQVGSSGTSAGGPGPSGDGASAQPPTAAGTVGRGPWRETGASVATVAAFGVVFLVYALWLQGGFYDVTRLSFNVSRSAPQLVLAVAVAVCMCGHRFDLSVAAVATAGCFLTVGAFIDAGLPMAAALVLTLLMGAVAGLLNGILVTRFRINAFIATLGTGGLITGFTVVYSAGEVVGPTPGSGPLPGWFSGAGSLGDFQNKVPPAVGILVTAAVVAAMLISLDQRFPGPDARRRIQGTVLGLVGVLLVGGAWALGLTAEFDWMIVITLVLTLLVWTVMKYTAIGHAIYAVGGNPSAAAFAGIRTDLISACLFVFSGTIAALAGILIASQQGSASPGVADPLLLPAYAGAFLSTVILSRGRFHIWGTVGGSIALVYVTDGLVVGGVEYTWTQVINGAVLIVAVALSTFLQRRPGS
ncbi:ABC transporter permease [Actinomadura sp. SCN-SB]|uniref:ABC transporter permease n=1 Tax=Actinomadura sp. SCN-SB TaxID=3373092 RepID=UPI003751C4D7